MGIDLNLLPMEADFEDWGYSHTILPCSRNDDLHDAIQALPQMPVPARFTTFRSCEGEDGTWEDSHYGQTHKTPYDEPLTCVRVSDLCSIPDTLINNGKDRATWAYLRELPPTMRVAVYWH